jgi:benzoate membrane transport protein
MERAQPLTAGLITALVGFTSSFTVVLAGLRAAGASEAQAASGLLTVSVLMGLLGIWASIRFRMPISIAWSTPGAALLLATGDPAGGFGVTVGAFIVCGAMIALTGVLRPLRTWVLAIPKPIANALLAGVLLELCVVPVTTLRERPLLAAPIVLTWVVLFRLARRWAVPAAMAVAVFEIVAEAGRAGIHGHALAPSLSLTVPRFDLATLTLGLSLFIVTMASQNVPGIAVLDSFGYVAPVRPVLLATGGATVLGAALGGHVVNLAAISAALCAGPQAHPDRGRRWLASATAGVCYLVFGCAAGVLATLVALAPSGLVETVAGLALLSTLGAALAAAMAEDVATAPAGGGRREAAVATFLITASGISVAGVGSAFWGLLAGIALVVAFGAWPRSACGRPQRPSTRLTAPATSDGRP